MAVAAGIAIAIAFLTEPSPPEITLVDVVSGADPEISAVARETAEVVKNLLQSHPNQVDSWNLLAEFYYNFGKKNEAVKCWNRCLKLDPGFSQGHF